MRRRAGRKRCGGPQERPGWESCARRALGRFGRRFPRPTPARTRCGGWEGPCQISRPTARFLPETASRRETRTTHRPTSYEPLLPNFVSDRRRPRGERCPTLRWPDRLETAPKETIVGHFAWFLAVFSARKAAFAAAFFAMRRPTAGAQPGLPLGAWHSSSNLSESLALECQPVSPSASKTASVNSLLAIEPTRKKRSDLPTWALKHPQKLTFIHRTASWISHRRALLSTSQNTSKHSSQQQ